ncbi:electron transport complex subunit RsxG [Kangiella sediminilitoris]|uniref:Ion-translocating oxidoreductase complex subunit G n=1 Tax=Kangiella sediminilitoris TaxID=1144748 RepID=A0A1B3BBG7_9GAMM|nr:electron transport complex subunit RsxG [Kangiella sediminilitoris]AOE50138.1 electron transporter RnfG [Kangiella sediminilitoris]
MITKVISKNGLILAAFAGVCVGLIAVTYFITRDTINNEMRAALARTLDQLVPASAYDNDVHHDCTLIPVGSSLGNSSPLEVYRMRKEQSPVALVMETIAPNGYSGKISLVVGIYNDGTLAGVRATDHKETPGLGDKIDVKKSDWILGFEGLSLNNPPLEQWKVKKDGGVFDAFTGATITPRAVIEQVSQTLLYFEEHREELFQSPTNCGEGDVAENAGAKS